MKKVVSVIFLLSMLIFISGCEKSGEVSFEDVMGAEVAIASVQDRIPFEGFDDYMNAYREELPQVGYSGAIVRIKPLERTQYVVIETDTSGERYVRGKTVTDIRILQVYDINGEFDIESGNTFEVGQKYYLQPKSEEGIERMLESVGAVFERDDDGTAVSCDLSDGTYEYQVQTTEDYRLMINPNVVPLDENQEYYAVLYCLNGKVTLDLVVPTSTYDVKTIEVYRNLLIDDDILEVQKGLYEYCESIAEAD